jgi:hypothetical protein
VTDKLAPCLGRWSLFDSTNVHSHRVARSICAACPFIAECAEELEATRRAAKPGYGPRGTWAGRLVGVQKAEDRERTRREDAAFDVDEAREAHAAYRRGDRGAWAVVGHNVYERRRKRPDRSKGAAA